MRRLLPGLLLLLAPAAAEAQGTRATYEVHALGGTVLELEARFELTERGYRVETRMRTRGIAAVLVAAENVSRAEGGWAGDRPAPAEFLSEGTWRGSTRRIALGWRGAEPRVLELVPPEPEAERERVPEAMQIGTVDILSAFAGLARHVGRAGHCDLAAPIFDGRRRNDFATRSEGREVIRPWRGAWHGEALRCGYEGRMVAGFRRDRDRARDAEPQRGTAWIAAPYPGAPAIPVRLDIPSRMLGSMTAVLVRAEPDGAVPVRGPAGR